MASTHDDIRYNYLKIKENIENAVAKKSIDYNSIKFLGATKTVSADDINFAINLGLSYIGENRVQEMLSKYDELNLNSCKNHFIGRLQTNKIKYIVDKVECIHSVDSMAQIHEISKRMKPLNREMSILIEVNIGDEQSKGGVAPERLLEFIDEARNISHIKIDGLMCIPPVFGGNRKKNKFFEKMYQYYVDIQSKKLDNISMDILSMGMSDDYVQAIESGANLVRIGSALFGERQY